MHCRTTVEQKNDRYEWPAVNMRYKTVLWLQVIVFACAQTCGSPQMSLAQLSRDQQQQVADRDRAVTAAFSVKKFLCCCHLCALPDVPLHQRTNFYSRTTCYKHRDRPRASNAAAGLPFFSDERLKELHIAALLGEGAQPTTALGDLGLPSSIAEPSGGGGQHADPAQPDSPQRSASNASLAPSSKHASDDEEVFGAQPGCRIFWFAALEALVLYDCGFILSFVGYLNTHLNTCCRLFRACKWSTSSGQTCARHSAKSPR